MAEEKKSKRRRSSLCPNRISLLPTELVEQNTVAKPKLPETEEIINFLTNALKTVNEEFASSDNVNPFPEDCSAISGKVVGTLTSKTEEEGERPSDVCNIEDIVQYKENRVASLNEEKHKWDVLMKKFEEEAESVKDKQLEALRDVPDLIKKKAEDNNLLVGHFPYEKIIKNCQITTDKTLLILEECVTKSHKLSKFQNTFDNLLNRQYESFTKSIQDSISDNSDVDKLIENRLAFVSPSSK